MGGAYYNEIDATNAACINAVMSGDLIPFGKIDTRSIKDIQPNELADIHQAHFFAGAGAWAYAARLAGWPDDQPLWTGSCPCQPFSQAGRRAGTADERHLWPDFYRLIREARPPVVVGEQVAGAAGYDWFDGVAADLEREGYEVWTVDIPAAAVDAPHIRQRLYWAALAVAECEGWQGQLREPGSVSAPRGGRASNQPERRDEFDGGQLVNPAGIGRREGRAEPEFRSRRATAAGADAPVELDHAIEPGLEGQPRHGDGTARRSIEAGSVAPADGRNGSFWSDHEWLICHDNKARRTKPGLRLLVDGLPGRISQWRIAGNSIVIPLAVEFLKAVREEIEMTAATATGGFAQ